MEARIFISGSYADQYVIGLALRGTGYKGRIRKHFSVIFIYDKEEEARAALKLAWKRLEINKEMYDYCDEENEVISYGRGFACLRYEREHE